MSALERRAVEIAQEWEAKARRAQDLLASAVSQAEHFLGQREHLRITLEAVKSMCLPQTFIERARCPDRIANVVTQALESMP